MTTVGILGSGQVGRTLARAAVIHGYDVVIANSRGPHTLTGLVRDLGPRAHAADSRSAAASGSLVVLAYPYSATDRLPVAELAGKIVIDTNNYMPARDGRIRSIDNGEKTVHELRQAALPHSMVAKAFTHVQHHPPVRERADDVLDALPGLFRLARPGGAWDRSALVVSSDYPEAVELVDQLYDELGYDTVDNSPLSESWRSAPGTPMWAHHVHGQTRSELESNLRLAVHPRDLRRP